MIPYFLVAIFLLCLSFIEIDTYKGTFAYRIKRIFLFLAVVMLIIFSASASSRGDAPTYLDIFNNPDSYYHIEIGYIHLNKIIKWLGGSIFYVFLVMSMVSIISKVKVYNYYSPFPLLSIFYLYTSSFIYQEMGAIRFAFATSGLLLSIYFIEKRRYKEMFMTVIIASFFHFSTIVCLLLLVLNNIRFSKNKTLSFIVISMIMYFAGINIAEYILRFGAKVFPIFGEKAMGYMLISPPANLELGIMRRIFLFFVCLMLIPKNEFENSLIVKSYAFSIVLFCIFAPVDVIAHRFSVLFAAVEPIIISILLARVIKRDRFVLLFFIAVMQFINLYRTLYIYTDEINTWVPYTLIFSGDYE